VRELRHDFRAVYHVRYEDVGPDEAVDLILTLPEGSAWRRAGRPFGELSERERLAYDVVDAILRLTHMLSDARTTDGAPTLTRPSDLEARAAAAAEARARRERMESTEWEEA